MKTLECKSNKEWSNWLEKNHKLEREIWLVFYKKDSGEFILDYNFAVEEALCYGWIDSLIKKIDDKKYCRKFSVRKEKSKWSASNKNRIEKLVKEKRLKPAGKRIIKIAKQNGSWDKELKIEISLEISIEFENELSKNKIAKEYFYSLTKNFLNQFILWINTAKRDETKKKRINESIRLLTNKEKLGMK